MTRFYEDFEVGDEFTTAGRTITESDVVTFAGLSGDFSPIHMDAEFSKGTVHGQRIVHGPLGFSVFMGLMAQLRLTEGTGIALLGVTDWRFVAPIFLGDTVHGVMTIESKRETSHPGRGIINRRCKLVNQHDVVTQDGVIAAMVARREPGG
jgi:acyl dehydratase